MVEEIVVYLDREDLLTYREHMAEMQAVMLCCDDLTTDRARAAYLRDAELMADYRERYDLEDGYYLGVSVVHGGIRYLDEPED